MRTLDFMAGIFLALVVTLPVWLEPVVTKFQVPYPRMAIRAYNPHWQDMQNAKFAFCHQKMPDTKSVESCLLTLQVFI